MDDTQSIGSSTWVIMPRHSILLRCSLTFRHKALGHFLGVCIMGWASWQSQILYSLGNLPMPWNWSRNSLIKSSVDLMDVAALGAVAGLVVTAVVETGAGCVPGCLTMMAQFIFTTASFSLEGRPRMVGPGVSATYQYKFTLQGWVPGWWTHRVHHIEVYGIHCRQWVWYWHDPGQWVGQLGWSDLDKGIETHWGVTHCLQLWYWPWHRVRLSVFCWHLQAAV